MQITKIYKWIKELTDETLNQFSEYFYDDIRSYLDLDEIDHENLEASLKKSCGTKFNGLIGCQNKDEVKKWFDDVSGYIVMNLDTENIINNYFN